MTTFSLALAQRMMGGEWGGDVLQSLRSYLGAERAAWQGRPDLSRNPLRRWAHRTGTAYDGVAPLVLSVEQELAQALGDHPDVLALGSYRGVDPGARPLPTAQIRACREALHLRLGCGYAGVLLTHLEPGRELPPTAAPRVSLQVVPPTALRLEYGPHQDDEPIVVTRAIRWREGGEETAAEEVTDLSSWRRPQRVIREREGGRVYLEQAGEAYPYQLADGTPFHRCVVLGHPDYFVEVQPLIHATLRVAQSWTIWMAALTDAGFPARWVVGGRISGISSPSGVDLPSSSATTTVATGPQVVHLIESVGETEARPGQWGPGFDPLGVAQAIREYEADAISALGLPVSLERTGGEPTEAEARALRALQVRIYPELRWLDGEILRRASALLDPAAARLSHGARPVAYHHEVTELLRLATAAPATAQETPDV
jgi:hypothetical protein